VIQSGTNIIESKIFTAVPKRAFEKQGR